MRERIPEVSAVATTSGYCLATLRVALPVGSNNSRLLLFFAWKRIQASDTLSAVKVAPRMANDGPEGRT